MTHTGGGLSKYAPAAFLLTLVVLAVLFGTTATVSATASPTALDGEAPSFAVPDNETSGLVSGVTNDTSNTTDGAVSDATTDTTETITETTTDTTDTTETVENISGTTDDTVTASGSLSTNLTAGDTTTTTTTDTTLDDGLTTNSSGETTGTLNASENTSLTADADGIDANTTASVESVSLEAGVVVPTGSLLAALDLTDDATTNTTLDGSGGTDDPGTAATRTAPRPTTQQPEQGSDVDDENGHQRAAASAGAGDRTDPGDGLAELNGTQSLPGPVSTGVVVGSLAVGGVTVTRGRSILRWLQAAFEDSPLAAVLRYSRYDGSDPLAHEDRATIHRVVTDAPGVYLSAISEASGVPLSTVRHHVRILEEENLVTSVKVEGRRRYFPVETSDVELHVALSTPSRAAILELLADGGAAGVGELAAELDRDPSTLSHHLSRLEDAGLVERERDGRAVLNRLTPTAREGLAAATPTTPVADD
ncbi:winged helix-turn-helix transcriptional regulator [Haloarchaeobius sp. DT45]|uniref:winged helix-turn-helix transcriptional regulator n=1 Tax=Haloarchaeobius sp. DT45 TaxID=3446116 RepID=UPI003F6A573D